VATFTAGRDNIGVVLTPDGEVWTWGDVLGENSVKVIDQPWQVTNEE
jgi:alpha-tubulin suppressor-like RCC1 family protein